MTGAAKPLTHCRYCVVLHGRHETDCMVALRGCTQDDVPVENAYRKGVHQGLAMLDIWLDDHQTVDVRDLIHQARILARAARSDRGPQKWLMHSLLDRLEPTVITSTPIERFRNLIRRAAYAAEHGDTEPLMKDVFPAAMTKSGTHVGAFVYNALMNLLEATNEIAAKDQKENT